MKTIKVLFDFVKFTVPVLIEFGRNMVIKMTGNTFFASPFVALTQITTVINDLEVKFNAAQNGGKQQKADMRAATKALIALLRKQATYVDTVANGNESVILGSGFHTTHQPIPARRIDFAVENNGNTGELIVRHKAVKGARTYIWQHCPEKLPEYENDWAYVGFTTRRDFLMENLVPGSKHWFRVAWVTKEGLSSWSDPVMKIVI